MACDSAPVLKHVTFTPLTRAYVKVLHLAQAVGPRGEGLDELVDAALEYDRIRQEQIALDNATARLMEQIADD